MIDHLIEKTQLPDTAALLQLNCRRSPTVIYSLFNDPHIFNFLFVALQEPPVNPHTNLPSAHKGWNLVVPQPTNVLESSRPRSCLYINTKSNPEIQPIHSPSRDIAACTVRIQSTELLVINVYNQPSTFLGFEAMVSTLRNLPTPHRSCN